MTVVAKFEPWRAKLCDAEPGWERCTEARGARPSINSTGSQGGSTSPKAMVNDLPKAQNISRGSRSLLLTRCGQRVPP